MSTPEVFQLHPTAEEFAFVFGGQEPVLRVPAGSVIELSTEDCFGGRVRGVDDLPSQVCTFPYLNPVTGPVHVEGAEPGDALAVHFAEIRPSRTWGVSTTFPHFGALTASSTTAMLHEALEERVWIYEVDVEAGLCRYEARNCDYTVELPLDPFHGTAGVAPAANETIMSITPSAHGGNMDTPELRQGVTLYLPVNVPGGLLSVGDGHCRQGEGEVCGTAVEAAMETTVVVDVVKGAGLRWPRLQSEEFIISTGSAKPLEDAFRVSQHDLVAWTSALTGLDALDALQLVSQAGLAPVGNVVDSNYTMVAKLPTAVLNGACVFGGVHERLAGTGRQHLAHR